MRQGLEEATEATRNKLPALRKVLQSHEDFLSGLEGPQDECEVFRAVGGALRDRVKAEISSTEKFLHRADTLLEMAEKLSHAKARKSYQAWKRQKEDDPSSEYFTRQIERILR